MIFSKQTLSLVLLIILSNNIVACSCWLSKAAKAERALQKQRDELEFAYEDKRAEYSKRLGLPIDWHYTAGTSKRSLTQIQTDIAIYTAYLEKLARHTSARCVRENSVALTVLEPY